MVLLLLVFLMVNGGYVVILKKTIQHVLMIIYGEFCQCGSGICPSLLKWGLRLPAKSNNIHGERMVIQKALMINNIDLVVVNNTDCIFLIVVIEGEFMVIHNA